MMEIASLVLEKVVAYLSSLDWGYMITLIVLCYAMESKGVKKKMQRWTKIELQKKHRVLLIGVLYGVLIYYLRGYTLGDIEVLLQSFVFAMVFHKVLIEDAVEIMKSGFEKIKKGRRKREQRKYRKINCENEALKERRKNGSK